MNCHCKIRNRRFCCAFCIIKSMCRYVCGKVNLCDKKFESE